MTRVVVIGQGYVGLPLSRALSRAGLSVTGLDVSEHAVSLLNSGRSTVDDVSDSDVAEMLSRGYVATTKASAIADADVVVICVPTPLDEHRGPDLSAVIAATRSISEHLTPGTLVILESTTYPGTTDDVVRPILEERGLILDSDFWLAFSPERIDPGNPTFGLENTPKVVGGVTPASTDKAAEFYGRIVSTVVRTRGAKEAETAKLLENTYRHINIALVNEVAQLCHSLGIDVWDVIDAAATKPFGFQKFLPGPGVGGHCIPIDPNYLNYAVKENLGQPFRFVELAEDVNREMPRYTVSRVAALLEQAGSRLEGAKVLLLGVTYKANISDRRESPASDVAAALLEAGAEISFHDPRVDEWIVSEHEVPRVDDVEAAVSAADAVILLQAHREYDAEDLARRSRLFFDTRGVTSGRNSHRL